MSLIVGLDIGTKTLTGAVLSGKPGKFRLVDFFVEEIPTIGSPQGKEPADDEEDISTPPSLQEFLEKVLGDRNLKGQVEAVAGVDTKDCVVREFSVPFIRDDQIAKTVLFEAEGHFPGVDLEDVTLEFTKVGENDGKSQLIVWALKNEKIEERLSLLKAAGADPLYLDIDVAALFNTFALTPAFDPERSTLLVDMGTTSTKILLIEEGRLRKVRALRLDSAPPGGTRLIPEPASEPSDGNGGAPEGPAATGPGEGPGLALDDVSIEARFEEIETALSVLGAPSGEGSADGEAAAALDMDESGPIAILSDEDFLLLRDGSEDELEPDAVGLALADEPAQAAREEAAVGGEAEETRAGGASEGSPARFPGEARAEAAFDYEEYLERIAVEIQRSLAGVRLSSPIELICLTGGMSVYGAASKYLSEKLDVETVDLDLADRVETDLSPEESARAGRVGAVAVGLAAKALEHDRLGLDFRKGPYRYEHKFERLKYPLLVAATLFFLFSLQAVFWGIQEWKEEKRRLANFQLYSAETYKAFFGAEPPVGRDPYAAAKTQERVWKGKGVRRDERYLDVAEAVYNVGEVLHSTDMYFEIISMKLNLRAPLRKEKKKTVLRRPIESTVEIETTDRRAVRKVETAFRGARSKVFNAEVSSPRGPGDKIKVIAKLTVKDRKLKELQRAE